MPTEPALADLRQDYRLRSLEISDVAPEPIAQFEAWFADARALPNLLEANAMLLSTCSTEGKPSARVVLLKGVDERGFSFFTNFESRKGRELTENPFAALTFWWPPLERQVRIEGRVERVESEISETYFQSRPRGSQLGAWASPQSQPIADRSELEKKVAALEIEFSQKETLPLPPFWGGFRVVPEVVEFWQGRSSRLHDRLRFSKQTDGSWKIDRLAP